MCFLSVKWADWLTTAVQSQKALSAYFTSKPILPCGLLGRVSGAGFHGDRRTVVKVTRELTLIHSRLLPGLQKSPAEIGQNSLRNIIMANTLVSNDFIMFFILFNANIVVNLRITINVYSVRSKS